MCVLLIEPDYVLAQTYGQALQNAGYTVVVASGAEEAIHLADANRPELIVLELQLAEHNGVEFLYEFRSYTEWQDIPVIIQSLVPQYVTGLRPEVTDQLGIVAYLYKPATTLAKLLATIQNCLEPVQA